MKIFIVAGEPSGDIHAAKLMNKLKEINPNISFFGIGGKNMEQEGLKSIIPIEKISVVGFVEVIKKLLLFLKLKKQCQQIMLKENVDCFIPVDYPGFNIKLSKFAKQNNIPVFYYIAPQVWAWGKRRWQKMQNIITKLFVVFPFEEKYFLERNIDAKYVGHPLLLNPIFNAKKELELQYNSENNLIAFFPGSRNHEVIKNISLFAKTAQIIHKTNPNFKFGFAVSDNVNANIFDILKKYNFSYKLFNNSNELMLKARFGIVKVGTTTLEAALLNMNMLVAYKTTFTHYWIGKKLINLNFVALPNILANKEIVTEYIQKFATPKILSDAVLDFISDEHKCNKQKEEYDNIKKILIDSKTNIAEEILKYL
ncbi:MAG: lipid-A-disaccharide synthase [Bacteroidetes bacterium]|nr:lipid-A-disaccharide synthase [Bacteroidota bacterium]